MARFVRSYSRGRSSAATVDGMSGAEIVSDIETKNDTIQYQDDGVNVSTKGAIEYINFTGTSVTVTSPSAGNLEVAVTGGGSDANAIAYAIALG